MQYCSLIMLSLGLGQARAEQHIKQTFRVYYRVEVYSENGVTRSADILVTTESNNPSTVNTLYVKNVRPKSIELSWKPPQDQFTQMYEVKYYVKGQTDMSNNLTITTRNEEIIVTGLVEKTNYGLQVRAKRVGGGWGEWTLPFYQQTGSLSDPMYMRGNSTKDPVYTSSNSTEDPMYMSGDSIEDPVYMSSNSTKGPMYMIGDSTEDPMYMRGTSTEDPVPMSFKSTKIPEDMSNDSTKESVTNAIIGVVVAVILFLV